MLANIEEKFGSLTQKRENLLQHLATLSSEETLGTLLAKYT
jgi:hypothetical protein